ncbi:MAG: enoyl-CoA hydratase-related protein [Desulfobacterales bacterium]|jgi:2-(1,2-epoxy-1,2-dihydrophenyl)acetyl-CoA isomerase|nr:enoyl-CoA hydratase-related protein [Desulfobacterales bacterium]
MYETFDLVVSDGIARLTMNQPDLGNPFNEVCCREFGQVANDIAGRKEVRVVLLSARGQYFSVGGDIVRFSQHIDTMADVVREATGSLHMGMARLMRMNAPIVACVHATAMGGAVSVLSNCDLVYSARSARFGAAYSKLGFTCDLGGTFGLASRIGLARARRFLLIGEVIDAAEAERIGLVDHVVEDEEIRIQAEQAAIQLSKGPTRAYGEIRRLMARTMSQGFEAQLEDEAQAFMRAAVTLDAREGITAFIEKRGPMFSGL